MLGLCCQYIEKKIKRNGNVEFVNIVDEKGLQYGQHLKGKYPLSQIQKTWVDNANGLFSILKRVNSEGIKLFRVSSNVFPLHDSLPSELDSCQEVKSILAEAGKFIIDNNMRVTSHPDQFVVLSSNKQDVIQNSVRLLDHHAWIFDQMNLPISTFYAINIHGGAKGNSNILIESIKSLKQSTRGRLTLENDERSYNVNDLYEVYQETGTPILWDSHHHVFNDSGLSLEDALVKVKTTWGQVKPLTHLSNTDPSLVNGSFTERRKHSDYVHYFPDCQLQGNNNDEIDVEMEFKMKNLAILEAIKNFNVKLS